MNWLSKEKSKYWNKAYQEYSLESGLSIKQVSDLAFGENTIERGYSMEEVIEKLKLYCEFCSNNDASFEEFEQNG